MRLHFTERAAADLEAINSYLEPRSPEGARNVQQAMQRTFAHIADFPLSGRAQAMANLRKFGVARYPYNVYYTVDLDAGEVIIVTVRHVSRAPVFDDT